MEMISSVALPKVAFKNPPTAVLERVDNSSVASPIYFASGMMPRAERKKSQTGERPTNDPIRATGMAMRRIWKKVFMRKGVRIN